MLRPFYATESNLATPAIIPTHHNEVKHYDYYSPITLEAFNNASTEKGPFTVGVPKKEKKT
jgi:hypothetical protein